MFALGAGETLPVVTPIITDTLALAPIISDTLVTGLPVVAPGLRDLLLGLKHLGVGAAVKHIGHLKDAA